MNLEQVKEHIKEEEGFSNKVYLDHLGYGTIGYGHLVKPLDNFKHCYLILVSASHHHYQKCVVITTAIKDKSFEPSKYVSWTIN